MKNYIIADAKTAFEVFRDMRRSRKGGCRVEVTRSVRIPVIDVSPTLIHTIEGHVLINGDEATYKIARNAFGALSDGERRKVLPEPADGEFIWRMHFWEKLLQPVMTPGQLRASMAAILSWYIHIKKMRRDDRNAENTDFV